MSTPSPMACSIRWKNCNWTMKMMSSRTRRCSTLSSYQRLHRSVFIKECFWLLTLSVQLFPRVSTQEARVALSSLQRAFTEAERIIPGVTMELVNEIVESVEHVEDDR
jgi:hypothetical protein